MDFNHDDFQNKIEVDEEKENIPSSKYYIDPPKPTRYKEKKKISFFTMCIVAMISAMIGGIVMAYIAPAFLYGKYIPYPEMYQRNIKPNIEIVTKGKEIDVIPAVVKKSMPSVVGITTITVEKDFFFGVHRGQGVGTGVIVDHRGYILTNSHVVNDGQTEEVKVLLYDGRDLKADVLWNDPTLDLAIVKISAEDLPVATLGNSEDIEVGELSIAIGNPLGLEFERTVTSGIISGLERSIEINQFERIEGLIQTDASINPGNSGGPLLNNKGEVIGINTAKIRTGEGLGFAIPINIAKPIVDEFIEKGQFTKVYLGIRGISAEEYKMYYGGNLKSNKGVFIHEVFPNSPVSKAGMKPKDIIVAIDNKEINTMRQLIKQLYEYRPGNKVSIKVLRNDQEMNLEVLLEAKPKIEQ
ncbi:serine protease HtrA [Crassaminicella profunda]|uniref:serine protease HtrA n=1 Tax=Crassaminicella profunda TaxID=1286698 RepID=UPI001CA76C04|nr:trypsin-like peptidase domain-containing protein [Crassaminicella profunda]QZY55161.1 trypsin-like peptidase domain-containing protein [Crassaminicella profunda]